MVPVKQKFNQQKKNSSLNLNGSNIFRMSHEDKYRLPTNSVQSNSVFPDFNFGRVPIYNNEDGKFENANSSRHDWNGMAQMKSKISGTLGYVGESLKKEKEEELISGTLPPEIEEIPKDSIDASLTSPKNNSENAKGFSLLTLPVTSPVLENKNVGQHGVTTILQRGRLPQTISGTDSAISDSESVKHSIVAPGGAPGVNNAAAGNDCLPSTANAVLNWNVVSADANNWKVNVTSLALAGQINIKPWPSDPTHMVVPNTANPIDGGNINNTAGSSNHFQKAIDDMADYNSPGGGAGPNWHSTDASNAHEWAHWNTDYIADSVNSALGGNWPQANADLEALLQPKASSATAAEAKTALTPKVNLRLGTWRTATISRWNAIPDTPGVAGSTGYVAGMAVLNTHIAAVRAYATSKGW